MRGQNSMGAKACEKKSTDKKGRLSLGSQCAEFEYLMETKKDGTIILKPAVTVPVGEAWLWQNKEASKAVQIGLSQAREGNLVDDPMNPEDDCWISELDDTEN